jgi:hypothetical protein
MSVKMMNSHISEAKYQLIVLQLASVFPICVNHTGYSECLLGWSPSVFFLRL